MGNGQRLYRLDLDVSIDKTMVQHKGRLSFKQYIKNKPVRWGIRLWVLCKAKTDYVFNFQVYLGNDEGAVEYNLALRVVKHLLSLIEDKYHNLYMDNFYWPSSFLGAWNPKSTCLWNHKGKSKRVPQGIIITLAMETSGEGMKVLLSWLGMINFQYIWSPPFILQKA